MYSLEDLFCSVDDFCQQFEYRWHQQLLNYKLRHRQRHRQLCLSEIMTVLIAFHQSQRAHVQSLLYRAGVRQLAQGISRSSKLSKICPYGYRLLCYRCLYICDTALVDVRALRFKGSTSIVVCHNRRIGQHKVFSGRAARGKTSVDWFFGFKLHLVVNDCGELLNITLTPGNTDDRKPVPKLLQRLVGKVFAPSGLHFPIPCLTVMANARYSLDY